MVLAGVALTIIGVFFVLGASFFGPALSGRLGDRAASHSRFEHVRYLILGVAAIVIGILIMTGVFHH